MPNKELTSRLRQRAEEIALEKEAQSPDSIEALSLEEMRRMIHELRVDRIELEMQNEELRHLSISDITERKQTEDALMECEKEALSNNALIRSIMESPQDIIIFALNTSYCYTAFTQAHRNTMRAIWGVEIAVGMNKLDVITNSIDHEKARRNFDRAFQGQYFIEIEEYGDSLLYRTIYEDRYSPIFGDGGIVIGLTVFVTDITERKHAEEALRTSEERFRLAMDATTDGLWDWNITTGVVDYSPAWKGILGLEPVEPNYETWESRIHPDDRQEAIERLQGHLAGKTGQWSNEHRLLTAQGTWKWVLGRGRVVVRDAEGCPHRMIGTMTDISERKRSTESMRESEERFRILASLLPTGIYLTTPQGQCQYANPHWCEMAGLSLEESLGGGWVKGLHPEDRTSVISAWQQMVDSEGRWGLEYRFQTPDGKVTWVYGLAVPQRDSLQKIVGYVGVNIDITERKRAEEESRKSHEQIANILESISDAFFSLDDEMRVTYFNKASESLLGRCGGDVIGRNLFDAFPEARGSIFEERYRQAIREKCALNFETCFDVEPYRNWYEVRIFPQEKGISVFFQVTTERKRAEEALRRNEAKQGKMVANIGDVIVIIDQNGINRYKSPNITKCFGWRAEEVVGVSALENLHPDDLSSAKSFIGALMEKPNATDTTECRYRCKDGSYKWIEFTGVNLLHDPDIGGVLGNYHDITERKLAEDAMRASEALLSKSQEIAHVGSWDLDVAANRLTWSDEVYRIFGLRPQEFASTYEAFLNSVYPEDRTAVDSAYESSLREGRDIYEIEHRVIRKDTSEIRFVHERCMHIRGSSGHIVRSVGMVQDITERKRAHDALRESDARYRAVAQSAHDAIVTVDRAGKIVGWNQGAEHIFGYTEIEANSLTLTMLLPLRYHESHLTGMARMHAGEEKHIIRKNVEVEGRRKDGSEVPLELSMAEWQVADSHFYTAIIRDITQRKLLEEQFRQAQKMEAIGQLAGGVAHDFNNILAVMMIRLSFLRRNKILDKESLETVLELTMDAKRSSSLTRQLLLFSRRSVMEVELLDLNELVTNLLNMLRRLIGEHITVRFDPCESLPSVEADAVMLEQVLMNLSVNARDAMPQGGSLTIDIEPIQIVDEQLHGNITVPPGQFLCLSVTDSGCGMDEATLKRIFEPFFTTKEVGKGTGLGLATVHGIVAQHKGWVEVESELGKGSTFKVFLPATTKRKIEPTHTEKMAVIKGHESILLVEDEASLRQVVAKGLRLLGYRVLEAENGQTAMKLWQENSQQIDLLFSDMRMPEGLTGLDLAEKLKKENPNLKVIISSGYHMEIAGEGKPSSGDIVFFQKPFEFEALSKKIRDCLDRT